MVAEGLLFKPHGSKLFGPAASRDGRVKIERSVDLSPEKLKWFNEESKVYLYLPQAEFELIPVARSGKLAQGVPLQPIGRPLCRFLAKRYPPDAVSLAHKGPRYSLWRFLPTKKGGEARYPMAPDIENYDSNLGMVSTLTFGVSLIVRIEKWTLFKKATYITLENIHAYNLCKLLVIGRPTAMCDGLVLRNNTPNQHIPSSIISTCLVSEYPPALAACSPSKVNFWNKELRKFIAPFAKPVLKIYDDHVFCQSRIERSLNQVNPVITEPQISQSNNLPFLPCGRHPENVVTLCAPLYHNYIMKALSPRDGITIAIEDDQLAVRLEKQINRS